jgi:branched-chain amino acid transport system permease protein
VFAGGCALAGLAGVLGGNMFITEPGMAFAVGSIVFVVVVFGGMGSLAGAFVASLIIGTLQTFSVALDFSMLSLLAALGITVSEESNWYGLWSITISQTAPVLPYLLMVLMLIVRPRGLMGTRES